MFSQKKNDTEIAEHASISQAFKHFKMIVGLIVTIHTALLSLFWFWVFKYFIASSDANTGLLVYWYGFSATIILFPVFSSYFFSV